ncbi:hypothetical protein VNI00_012356 [Paramarasmius palmivorus]|uniref:FAS1 domain-containing protein n=1 Tax=Paramarasmius palmivorus TaxID=297713 RepID=A0AAW0C6M3_9AGAR
MRFLLRLSLLLVTALLAAAGKDFSKLRDGLKQYGLTSFADLNIAETQTGKTILSQLSEGTNFGIFAPTNAALSELSINTTMDAELVAILVSYHITQGNYYHSVDKSIFIDPFHYDTIATTLLNQSTFVQLENGLNQVIAWKQNGKDINVLNQPQNTHVLDAFLIEGYAIFSVDHVLSPPPQLSVVLKNNTVGKTDKIRALLDTTYVDIPDGKNKTLLKYFDEFYLNGYTFFAPSDDAFGPPFNTVLAGMKSDEILQLLLNHVVNGTTEYSNHLDSGLKAITGQSTELDYGKDGKVLYVKSGNVITKVLQPDVLVRNGVVHVIDAVLTDVPNKKQSD